MGIIETIIRSMDGCVGFLEVLTLVVSSGAVFLGVKTYQKHKHAVERVAHDHKASIRKKPAWWPFAILLTLALGVSFLAVWKYLFMPR